MGQTAQNPANRTARLPRVRPVAAALGLLAVGTLTGCGTPLSAATTSLRGVTDASVVHPDGTVVSAVDGLRLRRGDVVRTGPHGRAELLTRGRVLYEGSEAAVQVLDGARVDLRHGAVVVDAQHGPGLTMSMAGLTVSTGSGAAVRAERGVTVRLGALAGAVGVDSQTGRHLQITPLSQAIIGGDALPDSTADSPLRLTDDDGEAHAVPLLVRDDLALNSLAAGIDSTGDGTVRLVASAWHTATSTDVEPVPGGVGRSEQVLPVVIAAAAGGDTLRGYHVAVALRENGASWGVVAHRLHTSAAAVLAELSVFEKGAATGQVGTVPAALSFLAGGASAGHGSGSGSGGHGSNGGGQPASSPTPRPTASPSSSPDVVGGTIDRVLKLLPTPLPTVTSLLPVQLPTLPSLPVGGAATPAPLPAPTH